MKKKLVLVLATLMCISLCACGGNESTNGNNNSETKQEENGFTPNQPTEKEEETTTAPDNMTIEEMQQYYDVEKYLGTPRLEVLSTSFFIAEKNPETISLVDDHGAQYKIAFTEELKPNVDYKVILCDNDTPKDVNDDVIVYIFTTPIE